MKASEATIKRLTIYFVYLFIVWGCYRNFMVLPEHIEELVVKPILWLTPLVVILGRESRGLSSLGLVSKNMYQSVYLALILGSFFVLEAVIVNFVKYGSLVFGATIGSASFFASFGLTFATAVSEELVFRGYIFNRLLEVTKKEVLANAITTSLWAVIHVPIIIFVWKMDLPAAVVYLFLTVLFGAGSAFVFARTKNISSSILLHVLWQWPIILFR